MYNNYNYRRENYRKERLLNEVADRVAEILYEEYRQGRIDEFDFRKMMRNVAAGTAIGAATLLPSKAIAQSGTYTGKHFSSNPDVYTQYADPQERGNVRDYIPSANNNRIRGKVYNAPGAVKKGNNVTNLVDLTKAEWKKLKPSIDLDELTADTLLSSFEEHYKDLYMLFVNGELEGMNPDAVQHAAKVRDYYDTYMKGKEGSYRNKPSSLDKLDSRAQVFMLMELTPDLWEFRTNIPLEDVMSEGYPLPGTTIKLK